MTDTTDTEDSLKCERKPKYIMKKRWFCDVCNIKAFEKLEDAQKHEEQCTGVDGLDPKDVKYFYENYAPNFDEYLIKAGAETKDTKNASSSRETEKLYAEASSSPPPQTIEPPIEDSSDENFQNLQLSDQIMVLMRQETLRHLECAWEAQRRLALLCAEYDVPLRNED